MTLMTRDQILSATVLKSKRVRVPEWDSVIPEAEVILSELTAAGRDEYEASVVRTTGTGENTKIKIDSSNVRAKLVAMSIVDEDGNQMFSTEHVKDLGRLSAKAIDRLHDIAQELSAVGRDELEKLGNV